MRKFIAALKFPWLIFLNFLMKPHFDSFQKAINDDFKDFQPIIHLSKQIGVSPASLLCGILIVLFVMLLNGILADFPLFLIGFIYPFYKSTLALRQKVKQQIKFWLIYWVLFLGFIEFKKLFRVLLLFLPKNIFNVLIAVLLIALFYPRSKFVGVFHQKVIRPNIKKLEKLEEKLWQFLNQPKKSKLDEKIEIIDEKVGNFLNNIIANN